MIVHMQGLSFKEIPEDSDGNQSLGAFNSHDLFDGTHSSLDLGSASIACGLDMLAQQEPVSMKDQILEEERAYNLLSNFPQFSGMQGQASSLDSNTTSCIYKTLSCETMGYLARVFVYHGFPVSCIHCSSRSAPCLAQL